MRACLVLVGLVLLAPAAAAHASLAGATPLPGGQAAEGLDHVVVRLDAPTQPRFTRLDVRDASGASVMNGLVQVAGAEVRVPVTPLTPGRHVVAWRTLAPDGHVAQGGYAFVVGDAPLGATTGPLARDTTAESATAVAREGLLRGVAWLGVAAALGPPAVALARSGPARVRRLDAWTAVLGGVASLLLVAFLARALDVGLLDAARTWAGRWWGVRATALVAAGALLLAAPRAPVRARPRVVATALVPAAVALAASLPPQPFAMQPDAVFMTALALGAASTWWALPRHRMARVVGPAGILAALAHAALLGLPGAQVGAWPFALALGGAAAVVLAASFAPLVPRAPVLPLVLIALLVTGAVHAVPEPAAAPESAAAHETAPASDEAAAGDAPAAAASSGRASPPQGAYNET